MRTVLVTGGSKGIGKAIVEHLASLGYRVIFTYLKTSPEIAGEHILGYRVDITSLDDCLTFLNQLESDNMYPEILINNAGITSDAMFHKMSLEQFHAVLDTNLMSIFHLTQPIYNKMRQNLFGRIVNISSVNARKGQVGQVNYCASKAGIEGFTKALALEGARYGVTVNSISPGYIETDIVARIRSDIKESIKSTIPAGRFGRTIEVARLVAFLISDDSEFINGVNYDINGAMYLS
jgi:acetoacetyl-CoA reductase